MQVLINISEEDYKSVKNTVFSIGEMFETIKGRIYCAISGGTICTDDEGATGFFGNNFVIQKDSAMFMVENASTIIEADKEGKNEN